MIFCKVLQCKVTFMLMCSIKSKEFQKLFHVIKKCTLVSSLESPDEIIAIVTAYSVGEFAQCNMCAQPLHIMDKCLYEEWDNHIMSRELHYYWCNITQTFYCIQCFESSIDYCNRLLTPVYFKENQQEVKWCCYQLIQKSKLKECANFAHGDDNGWKTICICKNCISHQWKCVICQKFICSNCYDGGVYSSCVKCVQTICDECETKNDSVILYCIDCDDDLHDFNIIHSN